MFTPDELNKSIQSALGMPDAVPPGKSMALVAVAHADGSVQAALARRIGQRWQVAGEVEWHGGVLDAGASVKASW